ncbi:SPARC-related modular calcium-binding protein 1 isoform X3 [Aethina tumida]|uniref:SPARC-related modular calcium-binding protein 1 isoform X3 n=1 Tax=Aethina tumida TaxID=116153 RepID=UPI0021486A78|nr:SPARC-related modular calcium-binding protein 1 isoform X3 [Aethina tumida]
MWLPLPINAILPLGLFAVVAAAAGDICNPKACSKNNEKSVCGSDGLTYPNRCLFEKARCLNKTMTVVRRANCKTQRRCTEWTNLVHNSSSYSFKAKCRTDGSYDAAQCIPEIGYCWCVTPEGIPLTYTTMEIRPDSKPRCGKKKSPERRSPSRRKGKMCKPKDKDTFNHNLIRSFQKDYEINSGTENDNHTFILTWKFQTLDNNKDGYLDKLEYKDLKRMTKKAVRPKRCAKNFTRSCDVDGDQRISQQEWAECLTINFLHQGSQSMDRSFDYDTPEIRDDDPTDCISDRTTALSEETHLYVPECTPDGRYQKVQCYKSVGYCWCVHEDTGKTIPGTSVKNMTPTCDHQPTERLMKGCPDDKKTKFLQELFQHLQTKMTQMINETNTLNGLDYIDSKEERVAKWSFVVFDKNKSKALEKVEWKAFKDMVSGVKGLRKCGKKLPRYCDINKDRSISLTEWLECLNVHVFSLGVASSAHGKKTLSMLMED